MKPRGDFWGACGAEASLIGDRHVSWRRFFVPCTHTRVCIGADQHERTITHRQTCPRQTGVVTAMRHICSVKVTAQVSAAQLAIDEAPVADLPADKPFGLRPRKHRFTVGAPELEHASQGVGLAGLETAVMSESLALNPPRVQKFTRTWTRQTAHDAKFRTACSIATPTTQMQVTWSFCARSGSAFVLGSRRGHGWVRLGIAFVLLVNACFHAHAATPHEV